MENPKSEKPSGNISRRNYLWVIGILTFAGVAGGYIYYALVGCNAGCTIQSNPYLSMLWGGAMGYLIPDMFLKPRKEDEQETEKAD
ncbi:MAG: hypothetical protein ACK4VN_12735 [Bacteroidales bacterium]